MCSFHLLTYLALVLPLGLHARIDRIGGVWDSLRDASKPMPDIVGPTGIVISSECEYEHNGFIWQYFDTSARTCEVDNDTLVTCRVGYNGDDYIALDPSAVQRISPGFSFDVSGGFVQKKNLFLENVTLSDEESAKVNYSHWRVALKIHNGFFYGFEQLVRHLHSIGFTIDALDLKRTMVGLSDLQAAVDLLRGSLQLVNIKNISFNQPSGTLDLSNIFATHVYVCEMKGRQVKLKEVNNRENIGANIVRVIESELDNNRAIYVLPRGIAPVEGWDPFFDQRYNNPSTKQFSADSRMIWQQSFYPQIVARDRDCLNQSEASFLLSLSGIKYFTKEITAYLGRCIGTLYLDWNQVQRIEFGSIADTEAVYFFNMFPQSIPLYSLHGKEPVNFPYDSPFQFPIWGNFSDDLRTRYFIQGKCVELSLKNDLFICEICLMHQYGLHRTQDSIADKCDKAKKNPPRKNLKQCYWGQLQPLPEELTTSTKVMPGRVDPAVEKMTYCRPGEIPVNYSPFIRSIGDREVGGSEDSDLTNGPTVSDETESSSHVITAKMIILLMLSICSQIFRLHI